METSSGLSSSRARPSAVAPHGSQSTGLSGAGGGRAMSRRRGRSPCPGRYPASRRRNARSASATPGTRSASRRGGGAHDREAAAAEAPADALEVGAHGDRAAQRAAAADAEAGGARSTAPSPDTCTPGRSGRRAGAGRRPGGSRSRRAAIRRAVAARRVSKRLVEDLPAQIGHGVERRADGAAEAPAQRADGPRAREPHRRAPCEGDGRASASGSRGSARRRRTRRAPSPRTRRRRSRCSARSARPRAP